jgi:hypothetical protein
MTPITTDRYLMPGGELDGDWQIVAEGERGDWLWMAGWDRMALTGFWDRVKTGIVYAAQGRTPGKPVDCFTLYAKLGRKAVESRRMAA